METITSRQFVEDIKWELIDVNVDEQTFVFKVIPSVGSVIEDGHKAFKINVFTGNAVYKPQINLIDCQFSIKLNRGDVFVGKIISDEINELFILMWQLPFGEYKSFVPPIDKDEVSDDERDPEHWRKLMLCHFDGLYDAFPDVQYRLLPIEIACCYIEFDGTKDEKDIKGISQFIEVRDSNLKDKIIPKLNSIFRFRASFSAFCTSDIDETYQYNKKLLVRLDKYKWALINEVPSDGDNQAILFTASIQLNRELFIALLERDLFNRGLGNLSQIENEGIKGDL